MDNHLNNCAMRMHSASECTCGKADHDAQELEMQRRGSSMQHAIFNYPAQFVTQPDYSAHRGQTVCIVRKAMESEADGPREDCEQMYVVQAFDGWSGMAFESELEIVQ